MSEVGRPIFYDTETTGTRAGVDRIVEIAAYDAVKDVSFVSFVNPGIPIPPEASAVHNITDAMVADAPDFNQVGEDFANFCEGNVILIAHNNDNFDIHFLREEYKRFGKELPSDWRFFDTLKWARKYRPDLPRHALQFLREIFGFEANNAHRALDDVIMLKNIFYQMVDDLDIETVYELIYCSDSVETMPFGKFQGKPLNEVPKDYVNWLKKSGAFEKVENQNLKQKFKELSLL